MALLEVRNLTMRFGGITAVNCVNLSVNIGEIFSIIGPNGAGKTTVFNAVTGIYEPTEGEIAFGGKPLQAPFTWRIVATAAAIGFATALALALIAVNVDLLWKAAIRDNFRDPSAPFSYERALASAGEFVLYRDLLPLHFRPAKPLRPLGQLRNFGHFKTSPAPFAQAVGDGEAFERATGRELQQRKRQQAYEQQQREQEGGAFEEIGHGGESD